MERKEIEKVVKEVIFEKMGEFTGFNHAAEIDNEDGLATDMAMDSFDYAEVVMEMRIGKMEIKTLRKQSLNSLHRIG